MPPEQNETLGKIGPASSGLNLANHFLIAMPSIQDPIFGGTVVYVCEHNEKGVLGVVINKPTDMTMEVLFDRVDLKLAPGLRSSVVEQPIMFGGPVQDDRGFVLHSPGGRFSSSLTVTDDVAFTTSIDVLEAVASGAGPTRMLVSIGYAGWSPGQLEEEISRNGWLTVGADARVLFDLPIEQRYTAAIKLLGIDPLMLATEAGHA
ncbi:YqgE/AlgH family protein [Massilia sp.]|uniref:YqgE/AlgH family protein n=1 Tax=Massilia sp. TaxID=1882437 RepID=UPI00391B7DE1